MVEIARFKEDRIAELYNKMWQVVADKNDIPVDQAKMKFEIRQLWVEDFDGQSEATYVFDWSTDGDQTANAKTFNMQPVTKFEIVGIYGWHNGNAGITVNALKIWINNTKIREYFGRQLAGELNDTYVFDDPFYVSKTQNMRFIPNTTGGSATTRAFPLGWIVRAR